MFTDDVESVCSFSVVGEKTDNIVTEQPREGKQRERERERTSQRTKPQANEQKKSNQTTKINKSVNKTSANRVASHDQQYW